jgi:hypothetical protein
MAAQAAVLNAGGVVSVALSYNFFANASNASAGGSPRFGSMNGVTEDVLAAAMAGRGWMHCYEEWLGHGGDQDAAIVNNAVI